MAVNIQTFVLISLALLMGTTFSLVKEALHLLTPAQIITARYGIASVLALIWSGRYLPRLSLKDTTIGAAIGILIVLGHLCHTIGLQYITTSQSAFMMAFYVPLVPSLQLVLTRTKPDLLTWLAVFLAFIGLIFLTGNARYAPTPHSYMGMIITLASALILAASLVLTSRFIERMDNIRNVATVEILTCALAALLLIPSRELTHFHLTLPVATSLLILAFISAYKQFVVNWVQQSISPSHVMLILSIEPVFASFIGWMRAETFTSSTLYGGGFIIAAFVMSAWQLNKSHKN